MLTLDEQWVKRIPLEILKQVRVVVSHCYPDGSCPDGLAAAMIIKDVLPKATYCFCAHNTSAYESLEPEPGMLFVDITPPKDRVGAFREAGAIVLDHHKDAEVVVKSFGERGVFADEGEDQGVSGAVLAFRHVWLPLFFVNASLAARNERDREGVRHIVEHFAELVGIRDTWQKTNRRWREASELSATLYFFTDWMDGDGSPLEIERLSQRVMNVGPELMGKKVQDENRLLENMFRFTTLAGTEVAIFPSTHISDVAERATADVSVGFAFVMNVGKPTLRLSFRSRRRGKKPVDVSRIARMFPGGGGHPHASGCAVTLEDGAAKTGDTAFTALNPYLIVQYIMARFEAQVQTQFMSEGKR
jgi:hypothetical protein